MNKANNTQAPPLPEEHILVIKIGERDAGTLICTPKRFEDLALGWAFAQGVTVDARTQVEIVEKSKGSTATVKAQAPPVFAWRNYVSAGFDAGTLLSDTAASVPDDARMDADTFERQLRVVFDRFREERGAGGYHHAALTGESAIHTLAIDISRHNAVDKVVGYALRRGIDPRHSAIVLSGRISADIALKGARLGVPVIATRSLATAQAVALAEAAGVMLVCRALDHRRTAYGPGRLR